MLVTNITLTDRQYCYSDTLATMSFKMTIEIRRMYLYYLRAARLSAPLVAVGMPCASLTPTPYSTVSHSTISQRAANRTQDGTPLVNSSANRKTLTNIGLGLSPAPLTARLNAVTRRDGNNTALDEHQHCMK